MQAPAGTSRESQADAEGACELVYGAYITHTALPRVLFEQPHMSFVQLTVFSLAKHWFSTKWPLTNKLPIPLPNVMYSERGFLRNMGS